MERITASLIATLLLSSAAASVLAQKKHDPGASDTEIRFGQSIPYSGPRSSYGTLGKTQLAYFKKVNDEGGVKDDLKNAVAVAH